MSWKKDENGNFVTDANGNPIRLDANGNEQVITSDTIGTLNHESMTRRQELNELKAKLSDYDGIDAGEARKALETIKNTDLSKMVDAGKLDEVRTEVANQYSGQIDKLKEQIGQSDAQIRKLLVSNAFASSQFVKEKTILPSDVAESFFGNNFKVEDGKAVAYMNGVQVVSMKEPGKLAGFDEALEIMVNSYPNKDSILRGNNANGSGSQGSNVTQGKKWSDYTPQGLVDLRRSDPQAYERLKQTRS